MKFISTDSCGFAVLALVAGVLTLAGVAIAIASISVTMDITNNEFYRFQGETNSEQCGQWVYLYNMYNDIYEILCVYDDKVTVNYCEELNKYVEHTKLFMDSCWYSWNY